jgi:hypothetical protein
MKKLESWFTLNAPPVVFVDVCLERWIASVVGGTNLERIRQLGSTD